MGSSGLDYTVIIDGLIYGKGDHVLDHISHALHAFPLFARLAMEDSKLRPTAVEEAVRVLEASLVESRLSRPPVAVMGPEEITLSEAVRRIATVLGKKALVIPLPLFMHHCLAWCSEQVTDISIVSVAQVRILAEGVIWASPKCDPLPDGQIRMGLPEPRSFGWHDLRWFE